MKLRTFFRELNKYQKGFHRDTKVLVGDNQHVYEIEDVEYDVDQSAIVVNFVRNGDES